MSLLNLSVQTLRKAADLKEKIAGLEKQLAAILGSPTKPASTPTPKAPKKKWTMSKAVRAKMSAAAKKLWAERKAAKPAVKAKTVKKTRKKMSAAAKANLSKLAKARWAARKAIGKKKL